MKNVLLLLTSTKTTMLLLMAFGFSMAVATFIENDYGTPVARAEVYEAWWFEGLMAWLALNFFAHIPRYRLLSRAKWPIGLFHLAFVLILIGAGITRFLGREGIVHIREGQLADHYVTNQLFIRLSVGEGTHWRTLLDRPISLAFREFRPMEWELGGEGGLATLRLDRHLKHAREAWQPGPDTLLAVAIATGEGREDFYLKKGDSLLMGDQLLAYGTSPTAEVTIFRENGQWMIRSHQPMQVMEMATQQIGHLHAQQAQALQFRTLYQSEQGAFLVKSVHEGQQLAYEADDSPEANGPEVVAFSLWNNDGSLAQKGYYVLDSRLEKWQAVSLGNQRAAFALGPKEVPLPFAIRLDKFDLERYPGSQSPSSYASEVTVLGKEASFPYRIFMNNVLDHQGYRFYQASYDTDERGTVLSVNQDRPGTLTTYAGYALLGLAMFGAFFIKGSRFARLGRQLDRLQKVGAAGLLLIAVLWAQQAPAQAVETHLPIVPQDRAEAYGRLVVQDLDGRMKPLNTLANEIARKLTGGTSVKVPLHTGELATLTPEQFLLAVQLDPAVFSEMPLLKVAREKTPAVFEALGLSPTDRLAFRELVDDSGQYLLHDLVEEANRLKPAERNEQHKELLKLDERFNIFYAVLSGDFLRLFPNRHDLNHTWFSAQQHAQGFDEEDAVFVKNITPLYLNGLQKGLESGEWAQADEALGYMALYQQKAGASVYPTEATLQAELHYNRLNLGTKLFGIFWLLGAWMLLLAVARIFLEHPWLAKLWVGGSVAAWLGMAAFTYHLGLRWYIAKHPPWTDGFEMLLFVAWGVLASGLLFAGKSRFTIPVGLLFSGTLLFVAFLDWLNPEITNLMPVLHSYWLKIHVAVIVGSYAPLALAAVLALLSLLLLVAKPTQPGLQWWKNMQELALVNEKSIQIGLFLLTVGTFLGGVWANESWGRYWAWDPKETWALISIITYAVVLHLRLIPGVANAIAYQLASLWAFSAIIMTSYGVNYYLSGLHSYAKGDPVPVPAWVYVVVVILLAISLLAVWRYRGLGSQERAWLAGKALPQTEPQAVEAR